MSKNDNHRRVQSGVPIAPASEDIENQLDRLNKALLQVMTEIEVSSISRNPSRLSTNQDHYHYEDLKSPSFHSDDNFLPQDLEEKIEKLLLTIDQQQMMIEDFSSEEYRKLYDKKEQNSIFVEKIIQENLELKEKVKFGICNHDVAVLRKEILVQVRSEKNEENLKNRKKFEEKMGMIDELKEDYEKKRNEIIMGIEKLRIKEEILLQKEKEIRESRLAFDKYKFMWESNNNLGKTEEKPQKEPEKVNSHQRANSFASFSTFYNKNDGSNMLSPLKKESHKRNDSSEEVTQLENKPEQLKNLQFDLKNLENQLKNNENDPDFDLSRLELKIDQTKNKIATIRGEIAISESTKATKIINNVVVSIKREASRDENLKRSELLDQINKKITDLTPKSQKLASFTPLPIKPKPFEIKTFENSAESFPKKNLFPEKDEKNEGDLKKFNFDAKKKALFDKEKELTQKEAFLQQTWMRIPGARELIENVNLTLNKLNTEKSILEKERDEFEKERLEWIKNKEKFGDGKFNSKNRGYLG